MLRWVAIPHKFIRKCTPVILLPPFRDGPGSEASCPVGTQTDVPLFGTSGSPHAHSYRASRKAPPGKGKGFAEVEHHPQRSRRRRRLISGTVVVMRPFSSLQSENQKGDLQIDRLGGGPSLHI